MPLPATTLTQGMLIMEQHAQLSDFIQVKTKCKTCNVEAVSYTLITIAEDPTTPLGDMLQRYGYVQIECATCELIG